MKVKEFLAKYLPRRPGKLLNTKGEPIGTHDGVEFYTTGERRGFKLDPKHQSPEASALYVISKNKEENSLTVGTYEEFLEHMKKIKYLLLENCNFFTKPKVGEKYTIRIRHRGAKTKCKIKSVSKDFKKIELELCEPVCAPQAGQFGALYFKDLCIGGGAIAKLKEV